jgi:Leucine-rich repeat (LRR) protein
LLIAGSSFSKVLSINFTTTSLKRFPDLIAFVIESSNVVKIPQEFFKFNRKLERISFFACKITVFPSDVFFGLFNLRNIFLNANQHSQLPATLIKDCDNAERLSFGSDLLTQIPHNMLARKTKLISFKVSDSALTAIPPNYFDESHELNTIALFTNKITSLPAGIFDQNICLTEL